MRGRFDGIQIVVIINVSTKGWNCSNQQNQIEAVKFSRPQLHNELWKLECYSERYNEVWNVVLNFGKYWYATLNFGMVH